ncbi:thioredoxin 1 [Manihot esculenta]|uniref:Thioredoxin domain-containing protein n=1 Tax=Manihot esculenta TaxID=3983 RepID=A0A2C9W6G5_MANES|nr:thioredoxin 1 [Manihot esculenta]OAY54908.1 hypothetical protein MANES_03G111300v8 [Manihot esculenta]
MATVLDSLSIPRSHFFPKPTLSPCLTASASPISSTNRRPAVRLPEARGLKIRSFESIAQMPSLSRLVRGGRIVCEAQETAFKVLPVNEKTWRDLVLLSEIPVLVEFWAPWCGPCRMIHPVIDELAGEYAGKLKCYKLNTDDSPAIATEFGIRSIPTVMIFKDGEKKDAIIGAVPKSTLISSIEKFL